MLYTVNYGNLEWLKILDDVELQRRDESSAGPVVVLATNQVREHPAGILAENDQFSTIPTQLIKDRPCSFLFLIKT